MYTKEEIMKIFNSCKTMFDVMTAALIFKRLWQAGEPYDIHFVQERALMRTNYITDDGN